MTINTFFSDAGGTITPGRLSRRAYTSIGRIIRAVAEIEDMINVYLSHLTGTPEYKLLLMMGKSPLSQKIKLAETLERVSDEKAAAIPKLVELTNNMFTIRNATAHGVFQGLHNGGPYSFLLSTIEDPLDGEDVLSRKVLTVADQDLYNISMYCDRVVKQVEALLGVQELRETRLRLPLVPPRTVRSQALQRATRQRRRQPPQD